MKKSLLILVMLSSMVLAACGSEETKKNNGTNNGKQNNGRTNNGNPNNGATNNGATNNGATNNGVTVNNTTTNNMTNNTNNMTNNGTTNQNNQNCVESTVAGPCDALCQTGCADMQTCVAGIFMQGGMPEEICQPIGPGIQGAACDQNAPCAKGFGCLGGTCNKYCRLPDGMPSCGAGEGCVGFAEGANIGVCRSGCTFLPDSCAATEKCVSVSATATTCIPAGAKAVGEACAAGECGKGAACIGPQGGPTNCRTICDPNNATQCTAPEVCRMLGAGAPFGACIAP